MCTGHPFLFSTHRSYSKQLSPLSPASSNFPSTLNLSHQHTKHALIDLILKNKKLDSIPSLNSYLLVFIYPWKNLSIFTLSLISFSLECNPNRLSPSPFHWSSWYHDHWWPSCCQTQWSASNLRVTQPAAAFNTVYHSFWNPWFCWYPGTRPLGSWPSWPVTSPFPQPLMLGRLGLHVLCSFFATYSQTEDEMVGWHPWLNRHEFEPALGDDEGQGSLACFSPWSCKESDTTEWLNWTDVHSFSRQSCQVLWLLTLCLYRYISYSKLDVSL